MKTFLVLVVALANAVSGIARATDFSVTDQALRAGNFEAALAALKKVPTDTRQDLYGVLLRQGEIALGTRV